MNFPDWGTLSAAISRPRDPAQPKKESTMSSRPVWGISFIVVTTLLVGATVVILPGT